jgi:hypothetical protein
VDMVVEAYEAFVKSRLKSTKMTGNPDPQL